MLWLSPYYGDNGPNGGIPIILDTTEPAAMDSPRPASVLQNYDQIISDLREAAKQPPLFLCSSTPKSTACPTRP